MKSEENQSAAVLIYLVVRKTISATMWFSFFVAVFISMHVTLSLLTGGGLSHAVFSPNFSWDVFVTSMLPAILSGAFLYATVSAFVTQHFRTITLEEDGVEITRGAFRKSTKFLPYKHIHQVDMKQSLVGRVLKFAQLSIEAGGNTATRYRHLTLAEANRLKNRIIGSR